MQITKQTSHNSSFQQLLYYRINGEQDYYTDIASRSEKLNSPMSMRFHSETRPSPPLIKVKCIINYQKWCQINLCKWATVDFTL